MSQLSSVGAIPNLVRSGYGPLSISSGVQYGGPSSVGLSSGAIAGSYHRTCISCGKVWYPLVSGEQTTAIHIVPPIPSSGAVYCHDCAGYLPEERRFRTEKEVVGKFFREHGPLVDADDNVTADWFEERGMQSIADYLRSRT